MTRLEDLFASHGRAGSQQEFLTWARELRAAAQPHEAATAYDRAYALAPTDEAIVRERAALLDSLAVVEHGIAFRFIPAGSFLMGSDDREVDEQPVHVVRLASFWLSEAPISWATFCALMGWAPPPLGLPTSAIDRAADNMPDRMARFLLEQDNKIRLQYCEDLTTRAISWPAHVPEKSSPSAADAKRVGMFGRVARENANAPWSWDEKPMVAITWPLIEELCRRISTEDVSYRLPTEAEWEKACRGGLTDGIYSWGNEFPDPTRCDFNRFDEFSIQPSRRFPPNGYGLYAMNGGVWEWTADWYQRDYYSQSPEENPTGPAEGEAKVVRGGSWADCGEATTASFRMSCGIQYSEGHGWLGGGPNIGFRLCRVVERRKEDDKLGGDPEFRT